MMKHISVFSGQGGFDLAADWAGWDNIAHCELNEFCLRILKYYWPNAKSHRDIKTTDFTVYRGLIDVLSGGFPCQPFSLAGKRKGKEDGRYLWPEMFRAIREIQSPWVVGENVSGLVNWDGGLVFEQVQADLESEGYEVVPFLLPAAGIEAPHERERIWFVAHCERYGFERNKEFPEIDHKGIRKGMAKRYEFNPLHDNGLTSNTNGQRLQERLQTGQRSVSEKERPFKGCKSSRVYSEVTGWDKFPTQSPICTGNDGLSDRLDGITFSEWRTESIRSGGNAIVPHLALKIFKTINQYESRRQG